MLLSRKLCSHLFVVRTAARLCLKLKTGLSCNYNSYEQQLDLSKYQKPTEREKALDMRTCTATHKPPPVRQVISTPASYCQRSQLVNIVSRLRLAHHLRLLHQLLSQPTPNILVVLCILVISLVVAIEMHGFAAAVRLVLRCQVCC
jgi:hypothetical protein